MKNSTLIALAVALVTTFGLTNASAVPPPFADFSVDLTNGLAPLTVTFNDASSTGVISNYSLNFGDNVVTNMPGATINLLHTYKTPGTYTVQLTVSGPMGFNTLTQPDFITVIPEPSTFLLVGAGLCIFLARLKPQR